MCQLEQLSRINHLFKKVVKMQSPRVQCCMCVLSVMSALLGMFMLSAGVCLVLNYNFLEVDTSGLPPNLHNDEGKKVVGIILICVGIVSLGVSGLVSILFYTACSRTSPATPSVDKGQSRPQGGQGGAGRGHQHSNGVSQAGAGRRSNGASAASAPAPANGRRRNDPRGRGGAAAALTPGAKDQGAGGYARSAGKVGRNGATPPGPGRPYRPGKKNHQNRHGQGRFRNSLPSHPEEAGGESSQGLGESGRSSARRLAYPERSGHVNEGARLDDEVCASAEILASGFSDSSVTPSVVIKVDSSYLTDRASASQTLPQQELDPELAQLSSSVLGAGASVTVTSEVDLTETRNAREEEESGRMSRSTVDSSDTTDGAEDSPEDAQRRLDRQINILVSERL